MFVHVNIVELLRRIHQRRNNTANSQSGLSWWRTFAKKFKNRDIIFDEFFLGRSLRAAPRSPDDAAPTPSSLTVGICRMSLWPLRLLRKVSLQFLSLRVEFLLKTDSGYPKDMGLLYSPWQPLGIPSAITPIGKLHQSLPSPIPGDLGRDRSHQSHVLEDRDTYGQAQVFSKGHQGSSVHRPCQPSFHWSKFWHAQNPLPSISFFLSFFLAFFLSFFGDKNDFRELKLLS